MLLGGNDWLDKFGNPMRELNDIKIVGVDCAGQFLIATKVNLLDCFFI